MTEIRSLSPADEACLCRAYPSTQKGGTLIAEDVHDLEAHEQRLAQPNSYRPASCPRCGSKLHILDLRPRGLRGEPAVATEVLRFRCADRERCGGGWQVLPEFLARCLWSSWTREYRPNKHPFSHFRGVSPGHQSFVSLRLEVLLA